MRKYLIVVLGLVGCSAVSKVQRQLGVQPLREYSVSTKSVAPEALEFLGDSADPAKERGIKRYKTGLSRYDAFFKEVAEARAKAAVGAALVSKAREDLRGFVEERFSEEYAGEELKKAKKVLKEEDDPSKWLKLLKKRLAEPEIKELGRIKEEAQLGVKLLGEGSESLKEAPAEAKKLVARVQKDFKGKDAFKAPNVLEALKKASADAASDAKEAAEAAEEGGKLVKALGEALK